MQATNITKMKNGAKSRIIFLTYIPLIFNHVANSKFTTEFFDIVMSVCNFDMNVGSLVLLFLRIRKVIDIANRHAKYNNGHNVEEQKYSVVSASSLNMHLK